jgi:hypothetical protein
MLALPLLACMGGRPAGDGQSSQASSSAAGSSTVGLHITQALQLGPGETIGQAMRTPFQEPIELQLDAPGHPQKTVTNCVEYLPIENSIYSAGSAMKFAELRSFGARCDGLDLLTKARPATQADFGDDPLAKLTVRDLPPGLTMIVSDEQKARATAAVGRGESILSVEPTAAYKPQGDKAELTAKNWTAAITLYARADFLHDGHEELLIERDASARQGSYESDRVYLLARPGGHGVARIVAERPR